MTFEEALDDLRAMAMTGSTRAIACDGIRLGWDDADDLGEAVLDWMQSRLDLVRTTDEHGVTFRPAKGGAR